MDPTGAASMSGKVKVGDQLCEVTPVTDAAATIPVNLLGAPFDFVMSTFAELDRSVTELDLVFFRGTRDELKAVCKGGEAGDDSETITVTVIQNKGSDDEKTKTLTAPAGVNVRELLVENGINGKPYNVCCLIEVLLVFLFSYDFHA